MRERLIVSDYGELPNLTSYLFSSAGVAVNASSCKFSHSSLRFYYISFSQLATNFGRLLLSFRFPLAITNNVAVFSKEFSNVA